MRAHVAVRELDWTPGAPKHPELAPHAVHLWAVDFAAQFARDSLDAHLHWLNADEIARGQQRRNAQSRASYWGGRIVMRRLLCAYSGVANARLQLGAGARGKPALLNRLSRGDLCFNYSLSGDKALYAVAWNRQLGVDLEIIPRTINYHRLAKRKLSVDEQRAWRRIRSGHAQAMLACWTRKEAYGKTLGVGIRYYLNRVALCTELDSPTWRCAVGGLFDDGRCDGGNDGKSNSNSNSDSDDNVGGNIDRVRVLHGVQIAPPFAGVGALMYDGDALDDAQLHGAQLRP